MRAGAVYNAVAEDTLFTLMNVGSDELQRRPSDDSVINPVIRQPHRRVRLACFPPSGRTLRFGRFLRRRFLAANR